MKFLLISLFAALSIAAAEAQEKKIQKFNPVYGSQSEINELLAFVSTNLKVELTQDQIKGINGAMVCTMKIDTMGAIHTIRVGRSLRPWIDYAIVGAMNRLPPYGVPSVDNKGRRREVDRQLVFSFGSFFLPMDHMGFNGEKVAQNIQDQIDEQMAEDRRKKTEHNAKWNNFYKENATLKYDSRNALKGGQPLLPDAMDPLKMPIITPRISISTSDELKKAAPIIKSGGEIPQAN